MLNFTSDKPILEATAHRPWPIPARPWAWYQEWNDVVFLHWKVPLSWLNVMVPEGLTIDTFQGDGWISMVAFDMNHARPPRLPAFSPLSDFYELNIRTYVTAGGKAGVYFLSIEASKQMACFLARSFSGLPYRFSQIKRSSQQFSCQNASSGSHFEISYNVGKKLIADKLDLWLTERYCLYHDIKGAIYRYEVHHKAWEISQLSLNSSQIKYDGYQSILKAPPDRCHYSAGVPVLAYAKEKIKVK